MARIDLTGGDGVSGQTGEQFREALNTMLTELYSLIHSRSHGLASDNDHAAAIADDYNKFLTTDPTDGTPFLRFILETDIPASIARQADLEAHINDLDNPHEVTKEQLGITDPIVYVGGAGIDVVDDDIMIEPDNLEDATDIQDGDVLLMGDAGDGGFDPKRVTFELIKESIFAGLYSATLIRQPVNGTNDTYYEVEVLATGEGITVTRSGSTLEVVIPTGVKLISLRARVSGLTTLTFEMTGDMTNDSWSTRWLPIVQAWREDTGQPISAVSVSAHTTAFNTFYVNGLVSATTNHIRLAF